MPFAKEFPPPRELVVDLFAGGGGTAGGIEMALGFPPDYACNHDPVALAMHCANYPQTVHYSKDVWKLDPLREIPAGPIGLLWLSPDCRHFSKAAGGALRNEKVRDLAWVAVKWAEQRQPRVIMLENVEEFLTWGPLNKDGQPNKARMGETFRRWVRALEALGYRVEWRVSRASDFGAYTIRKRLCVIARRDGLSINWPAATHAPRGSAAVITGESQQWRAAAEIIDWDVPCPSIFMTPEECEAWYRATGQRVQRPLVENTLGRIATGLRRFVLENPNPFIVPVGYGEREGQTPRTHDLGEPFPTVVSGGHHALVVPHLVHTAHGERDSKGRKRGAGAHAIEEPLGSVTRTGNKALVLAFLAQHNLGAVGHLPSSPLSTLTGRGTQQQIVAANLINLKGEGHRGAQDARDPVPALCAQGQHVAAVHAFMVKYYGTAVGFDLAEPYHTDTAKPRFGLVMVRGELHQIVDIGMRMLTPRERFRAQGFPDCYRIDIEHEGKPIGVVAQGRLCGNSVERHWAAAHVRANFAPLPVEMAEAA